MDERTLDESIKRLLESNDQGQVDSWMGLLLLAHHAILKSDFAEADQLLKLSLDYAEEKMSQEAVANALLCMAASYYKQKRLLESEPAYMRAIKILEECSRKSVLE